MSDEKPKQIGTDELTPWKTRESEELSTLQWVHWFNHTRLLTPIAGIHRQKLRQTTGGNSPSATPRRRRQLKPNSLLGSRGGCTPLTR